MAFQVNISKLPCRIGPRKIQYWIFRAPTRLRNQHPSEIHRSETSPVKICGESLQFRAPPNSHRQNDHRSRFSRERAGPKAPYKCAVTAIIRLDEGNILVRRNFLPRLRCDSDERIIRRVQDQRWNGDLVDYMRRRSAVIVILDVSEAAIVMPLSCHQIRAGCECRAAGLCRNGRERVELSEAFADEAPTGNIFRRAGSRIRAACLMTLPNQSRDSTPPPHEIAQVLVLAIPIPPPISTRCCHPWRIQPAPVAKRHRAR